MAFELLTSVKERLIELLFPVKCVVCEKETEQKRKNKFICTSCLKNLSPSLNFYCPLCEARTADAKLCFSCRALRSLGEGGQDHFYLDRLLYPFPYQDFKIQKVVKAFKYRFIKELEIPLGRLMVSYLEKIKNKIDLNDSTLVPVPLHKRKFNSRGYNQSELIAQQLSKFLNFRVANNCLIKNKATKDQASLKNEQRTKNIKGVFKCAEPEQMREKRILLVDDVYTTGTTMNECARVLKDEGAKEVIGLTIARG
ncbi:MAG: phosphoribosyltransferase [Parcubacteria group bacterium Gr01-1014_2]|nr:MAG: phosphoribosyltransferase [Parcubacteria group bacterium Gr01-1014_2]